MGDGTAGCTSAGPPVELTIKVGLESGTGMGRGGLGPNASFLRVGGWVAPERVSGSQLRGEASVGGWVLLQLLGRHCYCPTPIQTASPLLSTAPALA